MVLLTKLTAPDPLPLLVANLDSRCAIARTNLSKSFPLSPAPKPTTCGCRVFCALLLGGMIHSLLPRRAENLGTFALNPPRPSPGAGLLSCNP